MPKKMNVKSMLVLVVFAFIYYFWIQHSEQANNTRNDYQSYTEQVVTNNDVSSDINNKNTDKREVSNQYSFKNKYLAEQHFRKHGREVGSRSLEEYISDANNVIARADMVGVQSDGDKQYLVSKNCKYVVISNRGFIRTYFIPNDCVNYFNRQ